MINPTFALLRALGILVGSLFVATAPLVAADKAFLSLDGIAKFLGLMALGLVFITYDIRGNALFAKPSGKLYIFSNLLLIVLFLSVSLRLIADPDRGAAIKIVGCCFLILGFCSSWIAFANRRSTPAA